MNTYNRAWLVGLGAAGVIAVDGCGGPSTPEGLPTVEDLEPFEVEYVIREGGYRLLGYCGGEAARQVLAGDHAQVEYSVEGIAVQVGVYSYPEPEMAGQAVDAVAASTESCSSEEFPVRLEPDLAQQVADAAGVGVDQVTVQSGERVGARSDRSMVDLGDGRVVITTIGAGRPQPPSELVRVSALAVEAARSIEGLPDVDDVPYDPERP